IAGGGDELADIVELKIAVAGVALAARGLHRDEAAAVDRDIERGVGLVQPAFGEVAEGPAILHIGRAAIGALEIVFMRARGQIFLEQHVVGLEAVAVDVREVVGNHVEMTLECRLSRKSDEKRILHRWFSPLSPVRAARSPKRGAPTTSNRSGSPKPGGSLEVRAKAV